MPKGLLIKLQVKHQLCIHLLCKSLVGSCEYIAQSTSAFWCPFIDTPGTLLLLISTNEFEFIVLYLSFSFRTPRMKPPGLRYG